MAKWSYTLEEMPLIQCPICRVEFQPVRVSHRFCSEVCRQRHHWLLRSRKKRRARK